MNLENDNCSPDDPILDLSAAEFVKESLGFTIHLWQTRPNVTNTCRAFPTILLLVSIFANLPVAHGATNTFREWKRPVMTWVPPYAVSRCNTRLTESFGGVGMKDVLTHLGLQFWKPMR